MYLGREDLMISCSHWGMFFVPVNTGAANCMYQYLNFGELS